MKKRYVVLALVGILALAVLAPAAFAAVSGDQAAPDWFNRMFDFHKQWVDQAVQNGRITPEQGQVWNRHFDQMRSFHQQNGYGCPGLGGGMTGNGIYGGMMGGYWGQTKNGPSANGSN